MVWACAYFVISMVFIIISVGAHISGAPYETVKLLGYIATGWVFGGLYLWALIDMGRGE